MNFFKRLMELASIRLSVLSPRQVRYAITRKDWEDFGLVVIVSFLILIYKVNKS